MNRPLPPAATRFPPAPPAAPAPARTPWHAARQRFFRNKLAVAGLVGVAVLAVVALGADWLAPAPYDFAVLAEANQFPSVRHLFGTDPIGRDLLSRMIYGARISLTVGVGTQILVAGLGLPLGTLAGQGGGWVDYAIMRGVEVLTAIPIPLIALFLLAAWPPVAGAPGGGLFAVIGVLGLLGWGISAG